MAQRGRPSSYTDEIAAEICERIADGQSLVAICRDESMPSERTVRFWLAREEGNFLPLYVRAREQQTERYVDEMISIADSVAGERESSPAVHAARLAIDTRKWAASKLLPRKYGDRLGVDSTGSLTIKIVQGLGDAPDE